MLVLQQPNNLNTSVIGKCDYKIRAQQYEPLPWRQSEVAGPEEKPMSEIPVLYYPSFVHSQFEEKGKGCGRLLKSTVPLCHPLQSVRLSCYQHEAQNSRSTFMHTPPHLHETKSAYDCHMQKTNSTEAGK